MGLLFLLFGGYLFYEKVLGSVQGGTLRRAFGAAPLRVVGSARDVRTEGIVILKGSHGRGGDKLLPAHAIIHHRDLALHEELAEFLVGAVHLHGARVDIEQLVAFDFSH